MADKQKKKKIETASIANRRARGEFEILETKVVGLILLGTEVKSLRLGHGQLQESFVRIDKKDEGYLYGMTIPKYEFGNIYNHDPTRVRKLLMKKEELERWRARQERDTLTIVPLKLFFHGSWAKLEIALAKRKKLHDKRKDLKDKAVKLDMARELKDRNK